LSCATAPFKALIIPVARCEKIRSTSRKH
jgi:hypothetical protein